MSFLQASSRLANVFCAAAALRWRRCSCTQTALVTLTGIGGSNALGRRRAIAPFESIEPRSVVPSARRQHPGTGAGYPRRSCAGAGTRVALPRGPRIH